MAFLCPSSTKAYALGGGEGEVGGDPIQSRPRLCVCHHTPLAPDLPLTIINSHCLDSKLGQAPTAACTCARTSTTARSTCCGGSAGWVV